MVTTVKVNMDHQEASSQSTLARLTRRSIRSFVIRNGRITRAQAQALEQLMPQFGIPYQDKPITFNQVFETEAPVWLEIGFGNGDVLINVARMYPDVNLLGAEVHESGIGHALLGISHHELSNIRLIHHDAIEILENMLPTASLDKILLLFPDPWHKKKHHKRRIVQKDFLDAVAKTLKPGGTLHCATDWFEYGQWMIEHLEQDERFENCAGAGSVSPRPEWRPVTRFEQRGHKLGHTVTDLLYRRL